MPDNLRTRKGRREFVLEPKQITDYFGDSELAVEKNAKKKK